MNMTAFSEAIEALIKAVEKKENVWIIAITKELTDMYRAACKGSASNENARLKTLLSEANTLILKSADLAARPWLVTPEGHIRLQAWLKAWETEVDEMYGASGRPPFPNP